LARVLAIEVERISIGGPWCYRGSMMNRGASVELRVGGQTYRVASSATDDELQRLAGIVDT
jgi:hypothetical protein